MSALRLAVISDIHFACEKEQARGDNYELEIVTNPLLRLALRFYRHYVWLRHPLRNNYLLDDALARVQNADLLIANGDYSCDSGFVGLSDEAARESAHSCLDRLRGAQGERLHATLGDHEFGKTSFFGSCGGMRLASWEQVPALGVHPLWHVEAGDYILIGLTSSILGLPVYERDTLPEERPGWQEVRSEYMRQVNALFRSLSRQKRLILFCHDPTALPWLAREDAVRDRLGQIEQTVIGHLHSSLILHQSRVLSGMPRITFLGTTVQRLSGALREARLWRPFKVRLCPSLAGLELLKDGGYLTCDLVPGKAPAWTRHRLPRRNTTAHSA